MNNTEILCKKHAYLGKPSLLSAVTQHYCDQDWQPLPSLQLQRKRSGWTSFFFLFAQIISAPPPLFPQTPSTHPLIGRRSSFYHILKAEGGGGGGGWTAKAYLPEVSHLLHKIFSDTKLRRMQPCDIRKRVAFIHTKDDCRRSEWWNDRIPWESE